MNIHGSRTLVALACTFAMVLLSSCGGSDDTAESEPSAVTDEPTVDDAVGNDGVVDDGATTPEAPTGGGTAVTVDGQTYEFTPEEVQICYIDENGIFSATIVTGDYSQSFVVSLPPDGFSTDDVLMYATNFASVSLALDETQIWLASAYESDPSSVNNRPIPAGDSQVDDYRFDSSGASGTATFVDMEAAIDLDGSYIGQPVSRSFEVSCG